MASCYHSRWRRATSRHAPRHATRRHATCRHATRRHATRRHATHHHATRRATPHTAPRRTARNRATPRQPFGVIAPRAPHRLGPATRGSPLPCLQHCATGTPAPRIRPMLDASRPAMPRGRAQVVRSPHDATTGVANASGAAFEAPLLASGSLCTAPAQMAPVDARGKVCAELAYGAVEVRR
eukprot:7186429-Prymnesium_polylepis.3